MKMEQKDIRAYKENGLVSIVREGVNKIASVASYAAFLFAMGSFLYSLGIVSRLPNSKINRFQSEHPEIVQYSNAESDYERIAIEEENPNIQQSIREYRDIRNEDMKYVTYAVGGLVTAFACAGIVIATESKKKKNGTDQDGKNN